MIITLVTEHLCYMLKENKWLFSAFYWFVFIHALLTVIFLICISYIHQGPWFILQHFFQIKERMIMNHFSNFNSFTGLKNYSQNSIAHSVILMVHYAVVVAFYITKHTD